MRQEFWNARADQLRQYSVAGMTIGQVAKEAGLSYLTVKRYAEKFELVFESSRRGKGGAVSFYERRLSDIRQCADEGLTRNETAERLSICIQTVRRYASDHNIDFKHALEGRGVDQSRAEAMAAMYKGGKTLNDIGELYGLSRERVRQIIKKWHGITGVDGGIHVASARRQAVRQSAKERKAMEVYGCTHAEYRGLVALGNEMQSAGVGRYRTPTFAWRSQRNNARSRGIEWNISLWDWWDIWQKSGKWDSRGRGGDEYVMCRFGDVGAYEAGNVYIATSSHNCSVQPNNPYRKSHPRFGEVSAARLYQRKAGPPAMKANGLPIGVTALRGGRYQAQICIDGRNTYLGSFGTPEEAHGAYLNKLSELAEVAVAA